MIVLVVFILFIHIPFSVVYFSVFSAITDQLALIVLYSYNLTVIFSLTWQNMDMCCWTDLMIPIMFMLVNLWSWLNILINFTRFALATVTSHMLP